ncbi:hypothetical protein PsW64_04230 [Pseudovibrio sp. W64]|uniref:DUF1330 domain-containing protein n=1 Tax=unclassified Pseudovibrio TaxID=2627060 RepID=UPI00070D6306|nr:MULTISPECIES: DUF1330 domain-containing protein [unclassified Pseudovibrio]KZK78590.1 hypothetical protein PsW64_04230 [Pseudovibrio sp. W64]KZK85510.1 hypothetical protein PsAD46_03097 [Pseudovibrio sp. Ad46]KZL24488.1 hypothetical protein PsAD37_02737 [Pseudovibrio sp. Ad37]
MPKAYWVAHVTVTDPEPYKLYADGASAAFKKYSANVLARGGKFEDLEGTNHPRNVVIEFADMETAMACYNSEEYQAAKKHRENAGIANIIIVEGA